MTWSSRWRSCGPVRSRATWSIPICAAGKGRRTSSIPSRELEKVLGKTLGVPLFQEQAMRVAIECAGFTPGEADQLRRAMATFKHTGGVSKFGDKLIAGMVANGYEQEFAEKTFKQLEGFGSYGFPESHAASFALIAYASSWMKCWHPDVFCAALLNAQPMGFYAPAQIVRDARDHGVEVLPVCVNASRWDCTLEPMDQEDRFAVRLGMRMVKGLANADAAAIIAARAEQAIRFGRRSLAACRRCGRLARSARRSRRVPSVAAARPPRRALGDQGAARRAAAAVRRRLSPRDPNPSRKSGNQRSRSGR